MVTHAYADSKLDVETYKLKRLSSHTGFLKQGTKSLLQQVTVSP